MHITCGNLTGFLICIMYYTVSLINDYICILLLIFPHFPRHFQQFSSIQYQTINIKNEMFLKSFRWLHREKGKYQVKLKTRVFIIT